MLQRKIYPECKKSELTLNYYRLTTFFKWTSIFKCEGFITFFYGVSPRHAWILIFTLVWFSNLNKPLFQSIKIQHVISACNFPHNTSKKCKSIFCSQLNVNQWYLKWHFPLLLFYLLSFSVTPPHSQWLCLKLNYQTNTERSGWSWIKCHFISSTKPTTFKLKHLLTGSWH